MIDRKTYKLNWYQPDVAQVDMAQEVLQLWLFKELDALRQPEKLERSVRRSQKKKHFE